MLKPILLVEDDKRDLELTLVALERSRLANDVIVVRDGAAALGYLNRQGPYAGRADGNPAAILLDQKLPKVTGFEVLQQMRADARLKDVPVMMLSSSNEESDVRRSHELGVAAYVVKPVDLKQLVAAIEDLSVLWAVAQRTVDRVQRNEPPA